MDKQKFIEWALESGNSQQEIDNYIKKSENFASKVGVEPLYNISYSGKVSWGDFDEEDNDNVELTEEEQKIIDELLNRNFEMISIKDFVLKARSLGYHDDMIEDMIVRENKTLDKKEIHKDILDCLPQISID